MPVAKGGKKGQKGKKSKKISDQDARQKALIDARVNGLKKLRTEYIENAKLLMREPVKAILTAMDVAIVSKVDLSAFLITKSFLTGSDMWAISNTFGSYEWLKTLSLSSVRLDDVKMLKPLCELIAEHPTLDTLLLIDCKLNRESGYLLAKGLVHSNIQNLVLDFNDIGNGWVGLLSTIVPKPPCDSDWNCVICQSQTEPNDFAIRKEIPVQSRHQRPHLKLAKLSAKFTEMGPDAAELVSEMIRTPTFRHLDVSGNRLGALGISVLCEAVNSNEKMETLIAAANLVHIPRGSLSDEKSFPSNKTEPNLPLPSSGDEIKSEDEEWALNAATQLSEILSETKSKISVIDLRHNVIGDRASLLLLKGMEQQQSPPHIFRKILELNSWMDAFQKKNKKGAGRRDSKKKKATKKK